MPLRLILIHVVLLSAKKLALFCKRYGSNSIHEQMERGTVVPRIAGGWRPSVSRFEAERGPFLLY